MKYNKQFIQKVKEATDLYDLVLEYAPYMKYDDKGNNSVSCRCPHPDHTDEHASFNFKKDIQTWCCYGCHNGTKNVKNGNYGTDCFAFLQWISDGKISFNESIEILAKKSNIALPNDKNQEIYNMNYKTAISFMNNLETNKKCLDYLYYRGLNQNDIEEWLIGYNHIEDRINFPLFDKNKNIIGFNRRLITKETKGLNIKYKLPTGFEKSEYFYGLHNINKKYEYIIITEGMMDVIMATKYNVKNVVCTLGSSLSLFHVKLIKTLSLSPILIFDNDDKGVKGCKAAIEMLISNNIYPKVCILPKDLDLADLCTQCKSASNQYIKQHTYTYGYLQCKDIIEKYNKEKSKIECEHNKELMKIKYEHTKELHDLAIKYKPFIYTEMSKIPKEEKEVMKNFLNQEINIDI